MKKISKILSVFLAMTMLLGCCIFTVSAEADSAVWDGTVDTSWYYTAKDTTTDKNITISTAEQFAGLSELAADEVTFEGWTITLDADIYFNVGTASDFKTNTPANTWTPIAKFKGTFDGQGHVISGLYFNNTTVDTGVGLFGSLCGGTVRDVSVVNSYFAAKRNVGAIVGIIEDSASTVSGCYSDAIIYANPAGDDGAWSGGIIGQIMFGGTLVEKCWFAGSVLAESSTDNKATKCGGIVGYTNNSSYSTIRNCLMTGKVTAHAQIGGILGVALETANDGTVVENCLMLGKINATRNNNTLYIGQFAGVWRNGGRITLNNVYGLDTYEAQVDKPDFTGDKKVTVWVLGNGTIVTNNSATKSQTEITGDNAKTTLDSFDFDSVWQTVADSTPVLKALADEATGNYVKSSADEVYNGQPEMYTVTLTTPAQFAGVSELVKEGEAEATNLFKGWNIKLGEDMYFNTNFANGYENNAPANSWTPIAGFNGVLDGQGHTLNGLYCNLGTNNGAALINTLSGTVTNLSIVNSYFSGNKNIASVAGIANSGAEVSKIYSDAYLDSFVQQEGSYSGGIVGQSQAGGCNISECQFAGTLNVVGGNSWSQKAGGILGYTAESVTIKDCLVTGIVVADTQIGGIVGVTYNGANVSLSNCVFLGKIVSTRNNATTYVGSIVGVTWKSNLTVTMTNCYHEENYSAIYTAATPNKAYATAYYAALVASGTSGITINDSCAAFSLDNAESIVTAMGSAWEYSKNEFPMLKTVVDRFADANIFTAGVQTNEEENSFRLVAGIKGIDLEDYVSVSYKIEVVTKNGTLRDNEQSTNVYTGLIVDDAFKTAEDYFADYLYIRKVTGFDSNEKVTVICTPMLMHKDGRVICGTPDAFAFAFAD